MEEDLQLIHINYIGKKADGNRYYEFLFSRGPLETYWGKDFEHIPAYECNLEPDETYIHETKTLATTLSFKLLQESGSFSMQDGLDGIVALAWEDINFYDEHPEHRLIFHFGIMKSDVEMMLAQRDLQLS